MLGGKTHGVFLLLLPAFCYYYVHTYLLHILHKNEAKITPIIS